MRFSDWTTGVKTRLTPYSLNVMLGTQLWMVLPVCVLQLRFPGTGICPPAVKFADSPEIAVRVGSARTRETPACSNARSVAVRPGPPTPLSAPTVPLTAFPVGNDPPLRASGAVFERASPRPAAVEIHAELLEDCARDLDHGDA